ncbi:MAG: tetratricopeptide repeat protein [Gemmataceae bacterium]|nr:tetratricopeptide repeat protein [Gemmataceae bacterium]
MKRAKSRPERETTVAEAPTVSAGARWSRRLTIVLLLVLGALATYGVGRQIWGLQHWKQALRALNEGDAEGALVLLEECRRVWPDDPETTFQIARAYRHAGRSNDAHRFLKISRQQGLDEATAQWEAQLIDAAAGDFSRLEPELRRRLDDGRADLRDIGPVLLQGYLRLGRAEEAERLATRWIGEAPGDWRPYFYRAAARTQLSRDLLSTAFAGAKQDYERCIELKPNHATARLLLGNAYMMTGHFAEALPHLEEYVRLKPDDPAGLAEWARAMRGLARGSEARVRIDEFLSQHGGTAALYIVRGDLAMDDSQPGDALTWYRRAEAVAPNDEKVLFQIAQALRSLGRADDAQAYEKRWQARRDLTQRLNEAQQRASKNPRDLDARHEAGVSALQLGQESLGLRWLAEALKLDPDHRDTHRVLAEFFEKKGDQPAAEFHRRRAANPR